MSIQIDCFEARVDALVDDTLLSEREAQVYVLKFEEGFGPGEVALRLDLANSTVSEYTRRLRTKRREAAETIELAQNTITLFEGGDSGVDR